MLSHLLRSSVNTLKTKTECHHPSQQTEQQTECCPNRNRRRRKLHCRRRRTIAAAVQQDQIAAEVLQNNFCRISFLSVVIFPFAGLQLPFKINFGPFAQVSFGNIRQLGIKNYHPVPFGPFFTIARKLVFPGIGRGDIQINDFGTAGRIADFRVAPRLPTRITLLMLPAIVFSPYNIC